jgi:hypothetical protein
MSESARQRISEKQILRIIDANINRLREALRVIEEYYRFVRAEGPVSASLKRTRHSIEGIVAVFGAKRLLASRDVTSDPFSAAKGPKEPPRLDTTGILKANFKRGQEAARVIEEFAKASARPDQARRAKTIRFSLYALEKDFPG